MKTESPLKKHHFWLLLGAVPLFTMIGVLLVSARVGGKIEERAKLIEAENNAIKAKKDPKPKKLIEEAIKTYGEVEKRQGGLHKENWERQKALYVWPSRSKLLQKFDQMDLKFGAPLPNVENELAEFTKPEVYLNEYSSLWKKDAVGPGTGMADKVAPTQFLGGDWKNVLRHVNDWGVPSLITKDQVWLVMEDLWVQRSLLDAVRSVNEGMAAFHRARRETDGTIVVDPSFDDAGNKLDKDNKRIATPDAEKLKALFRNRTWAIELAVEKDGNALRLTGKLFNLTDRLQLMGIRNTMVLRVWFENLPQPMLFKIADREFLPGRGAKKTIKVDGRDVEVPADELTVLPIDSHLLPAGSEPAQILRVEQVFDPRTVPVRQINALVLSKLDSRNAAKPLVGPRPPFTQDPPPDADAAPAADAATGPPPPPPPPPPKGGPPSLPGVPPGSPPGSPPGGPPGGLPGGAAVSAGGAITDIADGNKKRYLEATDQVRRMPVGIVVVVDQSQLQDVLLAFANSPLRFQITQVTWKRFTGTLAGVVQSAVPTGPGSDIEVGNRGSNNIKGPGDPDAIYGPKRPSGPIGLPPGIGPGGFGPNSGTQGTSGVSESQVTSGLIELSIYGIISLYEKYEAPKAADAPEPEPKPAPAPTPGPTPTPSKKPRRAKRR